MYKKTVGGLHTYQKFPGSYADLPDFLYFFELPAGHGMCMKFPELPLEEALAMIPVPNCP